MTAPEARDNLDARRAWPTLAMALLVWWWGAPYLGIRHDALYYAGDALRRLPDSGLPHDLFFHRYSQGDFSVFGHLYAVLIRIAGLDVAALLLTMGGLLLWVGGLVALCRALPSRWPAVWLLALALCLPRQYGPYVALMSAEPFATARPWAEGLALWAVAAALRAQPLRALSTMAVSAAFHPLMGLGALPLVVALLPVRLRHGVLVVGTLGLALGIALGVQPFPRIREVYDDAWWQIVATMNPIAVFGSWAPYKLALALAAVLLLADAAASLPRGTALRRLCVALAVATVGFVGLWALGTVTRNTLLIQLQLWRALWLTQLLAPLLWVAAVGTRRPEGGWRWEVWFLAAGAWLSGLVSAPLLAALAILLRRHPASWVGWRRRHVAVQAIAIVAAAATLLPALVSALAPETLAAGLEAWPQSAAALLGDGAIAAFLVAAVAWLSRRMPPLGRAAAAGGSLLGVAGLAVWAAGWQPVDQRVDRAMADAVRDLVPASDTVWSDRGPYMAWLRLNRAHFGSWYQRAGALFAREPAMEGVRRLNLLTALDFERLEGLPMPAAAAAARRESRTARARRLCAEPALDWVLLTGAHPGADDVRPLGAGLPAVSIYRCRADASAPSGQRAP